MRVRTILITPEIAEEYLNRNTHNVALRESIVKLYANEMRAGRWKFTGDSIKFSGTKMLDGQHRCWAIIESGTSQMMVVVEGLEDEAFDCIDQGKRRTAGQVLKLAGYDGGSNLAAAVNIVRTHLNGGTRDRRRMSTAAVREWLEDHPGMQHASEAMPRGKSGLCPKSFMIAVFYLLYLKDAGDAVEFMQDFISGSNLGPKDPVHILRTRLLEKKVDASNQRSLMLALFIKAWNFRRAGMTITHLNYRDGGDNPEPWPKIK